MTIVGQITYFACTINHIIIIVPESSWAIMIINNNIPNRKGEHYIVFLLLLREMYNLALYYWYLTTEYYRPTDLNVSSNFIITN